MDNIHTTLTENMVHASTEFGIAVVKELVNESLRIKPDMSLNEFRTVLRDYLDKAKETIDRTKKESTSETIHL